MHYSAWTKHLIKIILVARSPLPVCPWLSLASWIYSGFDAGVCYTVTSTKPAEKPFLKTSPFDLVFGPPFCPYCYLPPFLGDIIKVTTNNTQNKQVYCLNQWKLFKILIRKLFIRLIWANAFLLLPFQGGIYLFQLIDWYSSAFALLLGSALEGIVVCWIYGKYIVAAWADPEGKRDRGSGPHWKITSCYRFP